jgi:hypothetical protein
MKKSWLRRERSVQLGPATAQSAILSTAPPNVYIPSPCEGGMFAASVWSSYDLQRHSPAGGKTKTRGDEEELEQGYEKENGGCVSALLSSLSFYTNVPSHSMISPSGRQGTIPARSLAALKEDCRLSPPQESSDRSRDREYRNRDRDSRRYRDNDRRNGHSSFSPPLSSSSIYWNV